MLLAKKKNIIKISSFSFDLDAEAFIISANIVDEIQQNAINSLVISLKSVNIWPKMKAIYPFVGGLESSHKYNLKDPRDVNEAYRLVFTGSFTHDSNGVTPNAGNHDANTFLIPNSILDRYSAHCSFYSRTDKAEPSVEIGPTSWQIAIKYSNVYYANINNPSAVGTSNTNSQGLFTASRTSDSVFRMFKNGTRVVDSVQATTTNETSSIRLFCFTPTTFMSTKNCAFVSIGDGLTDTDVSNLYAFVQAYQNTLGRDI